jgi:hypothetical protein
VDGDPRDALGLGYRDGLAGLPPDPAPWIAVAEAARLADRSARTIREWAQQGRIRSRVRTEGAPRFLDVHRLDVHHQAAHPPKRGRPFADPAD